MLKLLHVHKLELSSNETNERSNKARTNMFPCQCVPCVHCMHTYRESKFLPLVLTVGTDLLYGRADWDIPFLQNKGQQHNHQHPVDSATKMNYKNDYKNKSIIIS